VHYPVLASYHSFFNVPLSNSPELSAFIGWFPVLFYTAVYIGGMYKSTIVSPLEDADMDAEATRLGSRALL